MNGPKSGLRCISETVLCSKEHISNHGAVPTIYGVVRPPTPHMCAAKKIVWVTQPNAKPDFQELDIDGPLSNVLARARGLAEEADFVLAQILSPEGKVLATVGPGGSVHLT